MSTGDFEILLKRAQNRDEQAFAELYEMSVDRVYCFVYNRTLDTVLAEDVVSDVYMKLLRKLTTIQAKTEGEFFSWIFRVAYTTMIDAIRLRPDDASLDGTEAVGRESSHATDIDNKTRLGEVEKFLETLSERDRSILVMRIWDDMSYEEISAITGESVSNAKKIVSRTLQKISANVASFLLFVTSLDII